MTTVTVTADALRAYNHAGKTATCIAVSAIVQSAARILAAGKALGSVELSIEPPVFGVNAAVGDVPKPGECEEAERQRFARQRVGRQAFVSAVLDGVLQTLTEIAALDGVDLEVVDKRDLGVDSSLFRLAG